MRYALILLMLATACLGAINYYDPVVVGGTADGVNYAEISWGAPAPSGWTDPNTYVALWEMEATNTAGQSLDTASTNNATPKPTYASGPAWAIVGTNEYARVEHGYTFDGVDDRLAVSNIAANFNSPTGSMGGWSFVDIDDNAYNAPVWGAKDADATAGAVGFFYYLVSGGTEDSFQAFIANGTGNIQWRMKTANNTTDPYIGAWAHWCVVQNGTEPAMYINGLLRTDITWVTDLDRTMWLDDATSGAHPMDNINIGSRWLNGSAFGMFDGKLDSTFITETVLTSNAVYTIFQNTHPTNNVRIRP